MCDVYVYEDVAGGWTTHVKGLRVVSPAPEYWWPGITEEEFKEALDKHQKFMDSVERKPIGLPYDGETFNDPTAKECAERLLFLREVGYNVPQYAIDALLEESDE